MNGIAAETLAFCLEAGFYEASPSHHRGVAPGWMVQLAGQALSVIFVYPDRAVLMTQRDQVWRQASERRFASRAGLMSALLTLSMATAA